MLLTEAEIAKVREQGLHLTEKCGHCGKVLNQTFAWQRNEGGEKYCSETCLDTAEGPPPEGRKKKGGAK